MLRAPIHTQTVHCLPLNNASSIFARCFVTFLVVSVRCALIVRSCALIICVPHHQAWGSPQRPPPWTGPGSRDIYSSVELGVAPSSALVMVPRAASDAEGPSCAWRLKKQVVGGKACRLANTSLKLGLLEGLGSKQARMIASTSGSTLSGGILVLRGREGHTNRTTSRPKTRAQSSAAPLPLT